MNKKSILKFIGCVCAMSVLASALVVAFLGIFGVIEFSGGEKTAVQDKIDEKLFNEAEERKARQEEEKRKKDSEDNKAVEKEENENDEETEVTVPQDNNGDGKTVIVLDPGHGISSSAMSDAQKTADGWIYNPQKGGWGEWRHWKSGTTWQDCCGSGCTGRAPKGGGCWYAIGMGDRDTEPELNMNNALAAKKYLEQMGCEVRLTRGSDDNPSMTKRLEYCYPGGDTTKEPDADMFICIHANAGGGRGSYYIALSGLYDQAGIGADYIESGNALGKCINDRIVQSTQLPAAAGGRYDGYPELVLFCKSPITIAYMEIGFYDNDADLAILRNSSDAIGKAIADGVSDYMNM